MYRRLVRNMDLKVIGPKGDRAQRHPLVLVQLGGIRDPLKERLGHGEPEFIENVLGNLFHVGICRQCFLHDGLYSISCMLHIEHVIVQFLAYSPMRLLQRV